MIQKVVSMLITWETSEDRLMYSNICQRTVRLWSRGLGNSYLIWITLFRWDKCENGLKCNKCHTTVERLYHPDKYKRIFCDVRWESYNDFRDQGAISRKSVRFTIHKKKDNKLIENAKTTEDRLTKEASLT
jgi:hypothetical protein